MTYSYNSNMNHSKMIFMILLTISIVTVLTSQSITAYGKTTKDDSSGKTTTSTDKKDHETTNKITHHTTALPDEGHLMHIKVDKQISTAADNTNIGSNTVDQKSNKDNGDNTIPVITDDKTIKTKGTEDKTKDIGKDTPKDNTDKFTKNSTSGSSVDSSSGSSYTNNTKGGGGKPVITNDTKPIPDKYGPCGPAMILDKTGKCVLDKNCQYKDENQTIISCYNVKTRNIVIHESTNNQYNSHSSSKTTINNNNNNYVTNNNPTSFFGSSLLSNNIFRTTALNTLQPETLLLLDSKQLFDIAGDTNNAAIQSLFCTTSFKTVYSSQTKNWFVTGVVQNINTLGGGQPTTELSNIQAYASFFDKDGNPISTIQNIVVEPNTLAHDQEGRFTFTAGLDTDLLGVMPTFVAISYNVL